MNAGERRYHPLPRNSSVLRELQESGPQAMLDEMYVILNNHADWDRPDTGSAGWNRIMEQAGPDYVWEWLIMDKSAPWADLFTDRHRWNVAVAVAHTLKRMC